MPEPSESGQIIGRLHGAGLTYEQIGGALGGRNKSLMSQVARGIKPGANLRDALAELERRLSNVPAAERARAARETPLPEPPRRTRATGEAARVRRPTTIRGRSYATSTIKRQASRQGGAGLLRHSLADASAGGRTVAVTVSFDKGINVRPYGKSKHAQGGPGGSADMKLGDAGRVAAEVEAQHGGNFAEYVAAQALERGLLSGPAAGDAREAAQHIDSIELRAF